MKLEVRAVSDGSYSKTLGKTKKDWDAVRIDTAIKSALDEFADNKERRAAFLELLTCVRTRTSLLKPTPGIGTPGWFAPAFLINRLRSLASRQHHWIRPCETWRPDGSKLRLAFRSLTHHLLAYYPVPGFMDSAWDLAAGPEAFRQQAWFIRLGRGTPVRALNLPLVLTRCMEHHVRQAPDYFTVTQALRYGETRGLGGSQELACEIAIGRLGRSIEHTEFWRTVLKFLVAHPEVEPGQVNPIIDFVHANKFGGEPVVTVNGTESRNAPWPDFSIKGRTLKSVSRLVTAWHADLSANHPGHCFTWRRSDLQGYRFWEKQPDPEHDRDWNIQELTDSGALQAEGRTMRHCVYSYTERCCRGETTIWSLRLRVNGREKRVVTVEVDPRTRSIIQARAKCNARPGARSVEIIRQWAAFAGLQVRARL